MDRVLAVKLDVVGPTYNRSSLLKRTISSLQRAEVPASLDVTVYIVDNNSKDDTEKVVHESQTGSHPEIVYIRELKQGSSHA
jgi:glycosyltransferase involved in cell wall biosynthesis